MSPAPAIAITATGLVTSVGLTAPQSCAAIRAKISNPTETRFIDSGGQWIMAHQVELEQPWRGLTKLAKMATMAIEEALEGVPRDEWARVPLLLCVAEAERPGRMAGLDDELLARVEHELGVKFWPEASGIVPQGRVGVAVALRRARELLRLKDPASSQPSPPHVLVAATDSLLIWPTLSHYEREDRLLTERNSNGFMPGEGAGALLVSRSTGQRGELVCGGLGFAREAAHIASEDPLRADGLAQAIQAALAEAGLAMHDIDYRITDLSGEHYYFKEAALALSRTLRQRKETFDIWHPAECTGELGAAAGTTVLALAQAACRKAYTLGPTILAHLANDAGQRSALTLQYRAAA